MTTQKSLEYIGGLGQTDKMPCRDYSIPAAKCKTGSKLRKIKNSVCSICYASKFRYVFGNVKTANERRFKTLNKKNWVSAMVQAIRGTNESGFFRWHSAGDIQNEKHFKNIIEVVKATPEVKHWIPTREYKIVADFIKKNGPLPSNLTVRLSAFMIDGPAPTMLANKLGVQTSTVSKIAWTCPASSQGNKCLTCRNCWDKSVQDVTYRCH